MGSSIGKWAVVCISFAAALPAAQAQAQVKEEPWQYGATVYLWLPGISGRTQFPNGAGGPTLNVNAKDVLDKLDMAFMASAEARRGRWGGLVDWVYSDLSGDKSGTRALTIGGVGVTANLGLEVKTNVVTLLGTYMLAESPANVTSVVAGTRMLSTDETLRWSLSGNGPAGLGPTGTVGAGTTNWDAVVGIRGRARPDAAYGWYLPYYIDVGTGASRLTWQAMAGIGYAFDFGDVGLVWRYLDYTFKPSEAVQTLTFNGLALGVTFRW